MQKQVRMKHILLVNDWINSKGIRKFNKPGKFVRREREVLFSFVSSAFSSYSSSYSFSSLSSPSSSSKSSSSRSSSFPLSLTSFHCYGEGTPHLREEYGEREKEFCEGKRIKVDCKNYHGGRKRLYSTLNKSSLSSIATESSSFSFSSSSSSSSSFNYSSSLSSMAFHRLSTSTSSPFLSSSSRSFIENYHGRNFHSSSSSHISSTRGNLDSTPPAQPMENKPGSDLFAEIGSGGTSPSPKLPVVEGLSEASSKNAINATAVLGTAAAMETAEELVLGYSPPDLAIKALETLADFSGMPYWESIILGTLALRLLLLPLILKGLDNAAKMAHIQPELNKIKEYYEEKGLLKDSKGVRKYSLESAAILGRHNCSPLRSLYGPLASLFTFVPVFLGLRKIGDYVPAIKEGGMLWFTDLGAVDPTYILPCIVTATMLVQVQVGMDGMEQAMKDMNPQVKMAFQALPILFLPTVTIHLPAGVMLYWSTANTFSIFQTLAMKNDDVRRALGITIPPKTKLKKIGRGEEESNNLDPIKNLLKNMEAGRQKRKDLDDEILHGIKAGGRKTVANIPPPPKMNPSMAMEAYVEGKADKTITTFASNPKQRKPSTPASK